MNKVANKDRTNRIDVDVASVRKAPLHIPFLQA